MKQWDFLKKSFELEKLSHAYIFSGNDEAGKREIALKLAKFINCEQRSKSEKPCAVCRTCRAVQERRFSDVTFLQPEGTSDSTEASADKATAGKEIKITQIRNLSAYLSLRAWMSSYKIVVIEKADAMNQEAQSAFLKLLEEPKGNTLFLLLAEHASMLFDTIRSRSQEIKFYNFTQALEPSDEIKKNFEKLRSTSLHDRFAYAKKLSDSSENAQETLRGWLQYARMLLLETMGKEPKEISSLVRTLKTIQDTAYLIQNTNVNLRLSLERVMLEL